MAKDNKELDPLVLEVAGRVMRERGIHIVPDLDLPINEEGLGLDSMGRLELLQALEDASATGIPEKYWGGRKLQTLRDMSRLIARLKH